MEKQWLQSQAMYQAREKQNVLFSKLCPDISMSERIYAGMRNWVFYDHKRSVVATLKTGSNPFFIIELYTSNQMLQVDMISLVLLKVQHFLEFVSLWAFSSSFTPIKKNLNLLKVILNNPQMHTMFQTFCRFIEELKLWLVSDTHILSHSSLVHIRLYMTLHDTKLRLTLTVTMFSCWAFNNVLISLREVIGKPSFSFSIFNRLRATISSVFLSIAL